MSLTSKLQTASSDFQKLQEKLAKIVEVRQKLEAQLSENELVKKVRVCEMLPPPVLRAFEGICQTFT